MIVSSCHGVSVHATRLNSQMGQQGSSFVLFRKNCDIWHVVCHCAKLSRWFVMLISNILHQWFLCLCAFLFLDIFVSASDLNAVCYLLYAEKYGNEAGIPAVFQILYFIGWKPDKSQVTLFHGSCITAFQYPLYHSTDDYCLFIYLFIYFICCLLQKCCLTAWPHITWQFVKTHIKIAIMMTIVIIMFVDHYMKSYRGYYYYFCCCCWLY